MKTDFEQKQRIEINDDVSPFDGQFRPVPLGFLSHNGQMHHKAFLKRQEVAGLKGRLRNRGRGTPTNRHNQWAHSKIYTRSARAFLVCVHFSANDAQPQKFEARGTAELTASRTVSLSNFLKCFVGLTFSAPKSLPEHSNFSDSPELLWSKICSWRVGCCFLLAATPATPSGSSNAMYSFCINSRCCWTSCFWLEMKASKCINARAYALQWNEALASTSYKKNKKQTLRI